MVEPGKEFSVLLVGGFGHTGGVMNEWLRESSPVRLVAAAPTMPQESLEAYLNHPWARQFSPVVYVDLNEALSAEKPDLAVVSTRPDQIFSALHSVVRAGIDVIAEKPLALNAEDLHMLFNAVKKSRCRIMPMFSMRTLQAFQMAREWVADGAIGTPVLTHVQKSYKWGTRPEWFGNRALYGGTWPWVGIHALDMANFITGALPVSVSAFHANRTHPDYPDCEDVCSGHFKMNDGSFLTVNVDLLRSESADTHGDDYCRIVGTEGVIEAYASRGLVRVLQEHGIQEEQCDSTPQRFYADFLGTVADKTATCAETVLAFQLTDAILQARNAADTGTPQIINLKQWSLED